MTEESEVHPFDVFISYPTENKLAADAVCAKLEAGGIRCWIAPRDILPGQEWGDAIIHGLERCRVMVLIFSEHANNSPHVRREVERAVAKELPIIPVRIEKTLPARALEYGLSNTHWLDAFDPPLERHIEKLERVVRKLLQDQPVESLSSANNALAQRARHRRAAFWFALSVWLVFVGYVVFREWDIANWRVQPMTAEQKAIETKLNEIKLESLILDGMPLEEVAHILTKESKKADPKHDGISFTIFDGSRIVSTADANMFSVNPATGSLLTLDEVEVTIYPELKNVSLMSALRTIVNRVTVPIEWTIEDQGVVFFLYEPPPAPVWRTVPAAVVSVFFIIYLIHLKTGWLATRLRRVAFWFLFVIACGLFILAEMYVLGIQI